MILKTRQWRRWWWGNIFENNDSEYGDEGVSRNNDDYYDDVSKTKDVDDGNSGSKHGDAGNSRSMGDDKDEWCFQLEGIQTIKDTPTTDSDGARMMGLWATGYERGTGTNEARNSRSWERQGEDLKTLGMTHENEDR